MKKIIPYLLSLVAIVVIAISLTLAWYTLRNEKNVINATSDGISFVYKIGDSEEINSNSYNINNLTFFDPNSSTELAFFNDMACKIEITIINVSNKPINVNVSEGIISPIVEKDSLDNTISKAYAKCLLRTTQIDITNLSKINDLIEQENTLSLSLDQYSLAQDKNTISSACQVKFYAYIFGVQEISTAINDFLSKNYSFTINIEATSGQVN